MTFRRYLWAGLPPMVSLEDLFEQLSPSIDHRLVELVAGRYAELAPYWHRSLAKFESCAALEGNAAPLPMSLYEWRELVDGLRWNISLPENAHYGYSIDLFWIFVAQKAAERLLSEAMPPRPSEAETWHTAIIRGLHRTMEWVSQEDFAVACEERYGEPLRSTEDGKSWTVKGNVVGKEALKKALNRANRNHRNNT